jgi:ankyrin repeat protein
MQKRAKKYQLWGLGLLFLLAFVFICKSCLGSPLHYAAGGGDLDQAWQILERHPEQINSIDRYSGPRRIEEILLKMDLEAHGNPPHLTKGIPLLYAVVAGDQAMAELLIDHGADVNIPAEDGSTILFLAMEWGHNELASYLLSKGAKHNIFTASGLGDMAAVESLLEKDGSLCNAKDYEKKMPLHWAAQRNQIGTASLLLAKGADINAKDEYQYTALHEAALYGFVGMVQMLVVKGADINAPYKFDRLPIDFAADKGNIEVIRLLLSHGAKINRQDSHWGYSLLHDAAMEGHKEIVVFLLSQGANVHVVDKENRFPLHEAAEKGYEDIAELLVKADQNHDITAVVSNDVGELKAWLKQYPVSFKLCDPYQWTLLHYAAGWGGAEVIKTLVTAGADVAARDRSRRTPLHRAAATGNKVAVEILLEKGDPSFVNITDQGGMTPLHKAAAQGRRDIAEELLSHGAAIDARDTHGDTPLTLAAASGHKEVAEFLINKGAQLELKGRDNHTALWQSVQYGHREAASMLMAKGANIKCDNEIKWNILHLAVCLGRKRDIVEFALEQGIDVNAVDKFGQIPLHKAAGNGDKDIVELLLSKGADINAKDDDGLTPIRVAAEHKHPEIIAVLRQHEGKH